MPPPRTRPAGGLLIARFAGSDSERLAAAADQLAGLVDPDVHDVHVTEYVDGQQYADRPGLFLVDADLTGAAAAHLRAVLRLLPDWVVRVRVGTPRRRPPTSCGAGSRSSGSPAGAPSRGSPRHPTRWASPGAS
ncbi:hypothetical protein [Dactylosporangium cerinum]